MIAIAMAADEPKPMPRGNADETVTAKPESARFIFPRIRFKTAAAPSLLLRSTLIRSPHSGTTNSDGPSVAATDAVTAPGMGSASA